MNKSHRNNWGIYLLLGLVGYVLGKEILVKIMLSNCSRITVAVPYEVSGGGKSGTSVNFYYQVNGKLYKVSCSSRSGTSRRYVRFSCRYPSLSKIEVDEEVSAAVIKIPAEGWDKIPRASY